MDELVAAQEGGPDGSHPENIRESTGSENGDGRPYPGRGHQRPQSLTSHGTPCTCCGYQSESRSGSRYRSS